jgi:hypothetical protein
VPPYSFAFLIDGVDSTLLCRKRGDDHSGAGPLTADIAPSQLYSQQAKARTRNYTPFDGAPGVPNPILYRGVFIGAIICMDSNDTRVYVPISDKFSKLAGQ